MGPGVPPHLLKAAALPILVGGSLGIATKPACVGTFVPDKNVATLPFVHPDVAFVVTEVFV